MKRPVSVILQRCDYTAQSLDALMESVAPSLGIAGNLKGKRILIKPNLISSRGPLLACTDPRFIIAVSRWFVDREASVTVGDSPAFGSASGVLRHIGALTELIRLGAKVVEFATPKAFTLSNDIRVGVAAEALDCDLMVNLPKVKAHNQMHTTMAVKNFFGIVIGMRKSLLHMVHGGSHARFAGVILDLQALLPEHITIVDGISAMHVAGPLHGKSLALHCVAASMNPLAVDTALYAALELEHEKCPLLREARTRRYEAVFPNEIRYLSLNPSDFYGSGFVAPTDLAPVRFNPCRFLYGHLKRMVLAIRS